MTDEAHRQVVVLLLFEKATQDSILTHHTEHSLKLQHFLDKTWNLFELPGFLLVYRTYRMKLYCSSNFSNSLMANSPNFFSMMIAYLKLQLKVKNQNALIFDNT